MTDENKFELLSWVIDYADNIAHCQRFLDRGNLGWAKYHREVADQAFEHIKRTVEAL